MTFAHERPDTKLAHADPLELLVVRGEPGVCAIIGVSPPAERVRRARLFDALELAYGVRFEPRADGEWQGIDALLAIGAGYAAVMARVPAGLPSLITESEEETDRQGVVPVDFADRPGLPRALRGARLRDAFAAPLRAVTVGGEVLATLSGAPVWTTEGRPSAARHRVGVAPAELAADEALRDRLCPDRCLALLALAHFLRDLTQGDSPPPPLRASFLFDDPNLHWPTYGHLRYQEILRHAQAHGYHLGVAMVPLDGWLAHPRVARLFRDGATHLSVTVHGNDHRGPELRHAHTAGEANALTMQALSRTAAFERRTGVSVDRVMVPPHEAASQAAAVALLRAGFEAMCMTRPYPWLADGLHWLTRPPDAGPLTGWRPADIVAGGLPVLLRTSFDAPPEELVIRAFLGQPLIVYGHHDALADGPDVLAQAAETITNLGPVHWGSLASIARSSSETRLDRDALEVRLLSRRARLVIPAGARTVRVYTDAVSGQREPAVRVRAVTAGLPVAIEVRGGESAILERCGHLELELADPCEPPRAVRPRPLSIARRVASEGRDRASAFAGRRENSCRAS